MERVDDASITVYGPRNKLDAITREAVHQSNESLVVSPGCTRLKYFLVEAVHGGNTALRSVSLLATSPLINRHAWRRQRNGTDRET